MRFMHRLHQLIYIIHRQKLCGWTLHIPCLGLPHLTSAQLNNTPRAQLDTLFFNRVPKAGSEKLMELLNLLAKRNNFQARRDPKLIYETILMDRGFASRWLQAELLNCSGANSYSKHVAFVNFAQHGQPWPIYINLVRDPVERLISWFYYTRAPWYLAKRVKTFGQSFRLPTEQWLRKDFNHCILEHDPECVYTQQQRDHLDDHRRQTLFFCGQQHALCMPFNSQRAMQLAKRHVEQHYAVVGTWEDTNTTLSVLEAYIPRYFAGALSSYLQSSMEQLNRNALRPSISAEAIALLRRNLTHEIEFYRFVRQQDDDDDDNFNTAADLLNNTKNAEVDFVFFNRVPKVGSQSLMELMRRLGKINGFTHARNPGKAKETILMGKEVQKELMADLLTRPKPHIYSQHVAYINFTRFHLPRPIYINLVRDPIERIISWHYYVRARWYYNDMKAKLGDQAAPMPSDEFLDLDLDTCVKNKDPHCVFEQMQVKNPVGDHRRQTLFFCGMNKKICMPFNSPVAMQKAKRTVEADYAVVGTWEDTNITLTVLEHYIPKYFRNAKIAYYLGEERLSRVNRNNVTRIVSDETRQLLRKNLTNEIEFYEFCKQRLYLQYSALSQGPRFGDDDYLLMPEERGGDRKLDEEY
ncbi:heparan sulfate 2-O-sulfotransferase pipe-like [Drosophila busckii]|uniref:heparan sulfate 2-O-sulfotransferase pipe-like n=1 Tax=Drosophila busckii TaxID=30019 RepID=UPI0014332A9F|nr:heparan sulfate 2-O-sulfotransferase pipe-like [Drosophila busckii]